MGVMSCWCVTAGDAKRMKIPHMGDSQHAKTTNIVLDQVMFMGKKSRRMIKGTSKDDVLTGTQKNERIRGHAGDDIIDSGAGDGQGMGDEGSRSICDEGLCEGLYENHGY